MEIKYTNVPNRGYDNMVIEQPVINTISVESHGGSVTPVQHPQHQVFLPNLQHQVILQEQQHPVNAQNLQHQVILDQQHQLIAQNQQQNYNYSITNPPEAANIISQNDSQKRIIDTMNVLLDAVAEIDKKVKSILDLNLDYAEKFINQEKLILELQKEVMQQRLLLDKIVPHGDEVTLPTVVKHKSTQVIYTFRSETAITAFPQFETDLQAELQKELKKQQKSSYFPTIFNKQEQVEYEVKNIKSISEIDKNSAKMLLLCSFASSSRVEGETVAPYNKLFQSEFPNCKILCVVFRYGTNASPAKILLGGNSGKREEEIPSICFTFTSSGWSNNLSNASLNYILNILIK